MGVYVLHHAGTLEDLRLRLANETAAMRETVERANEEHEWGLSAESIDLVVGKQQFGHPDANTMLSVLINEHFPVVSNDFRWQGYAGLSRMVPQSALCTALASIIDGSGFFTRSWAHDIWLGCGYLGHDEVASAHEALVAYADRAQEEWREFIDDLRVAFERILEGGPAICMS
jgi:hypothetical protein